MCVFGKSKKLFVILLNFFLSSIVMFLESNPERVSVIQPERVSVIQVG